MDGLTPCAHVARAAVHDPAEARTAQQRRDYLLLNINTMRRYLGQPDWDGGKATIPQLERELAGVSATLAQSNRYLDRLRGTAS